MTTAKAPTGQSHEYLKSKTNCITVIVYILFLHIYILLKLHTEVRSSRLGLPYLRFHIILRQKWSDSIIGVHPDLGAIGLTRRWKPHYQYIRSRGVYCINTM